MTVNNFDPVTGRPNFSDNDAPDIKVDPGAAAAYAEEVGNRIVKANLAALDAYPYKRKGLAGYASDTGIEYLHNGTGWVKVIAPDTGWLPLNLALNTGWSVNTPDALEYRVMGGQLFLSGRLNASGGAGNAPFATNLPVGFRPSREMIMNVTTTGGTGASFATVVSPNGTVTVFKGASSVSNLPLQSLPGMPV